MGRTRIVKVSEEEYQLLNKARQELLKKGSDRLPSELKTEIEEHDRLGDLALGAIIGLGALALIALLLSGGKE